MTEATLVIVRADPDNRASNHPADVRIAQDEATSPPCWIILLGAVARSTGLLRFFFASPDASRATLRGVVFVR